MEGSLRTVSGGLLLLLAAGSACNDDCDERCQSDYDDCVSSARGDDERVARCAADRDQCMGTCANEPVDFSRER